MYRSLSETSDLYIHYYDGDVINNCVCFLFEDSKSNNVVTYVCALNILAMHIYLIYPTTCILNILV